MPSTSCADAGTIKLPPTTATAERSTPPRRGSNVPVANSKPAWRRSMNVVRVAGSKADVPINGASAAAAPVVTSTGALFAGGRKPPAVFVNSTRQEPVKGGPPQPAALTVGNIVVASKMLVVPINASPAVLTDPGSSARRVPRMYGKRNVAASPSTMSVVVDSGG